MSRTLLDMTQAILLSLDSFDVNSVSDNEESLQVAHIIREVYDEITLGEEFQRNWTLFELDPSGTSTKPTIMYKPENVRRIEWIKYNCETADDTVDAFKLIEYLTPLDYFQYMHSINDEDDNVVKYTHIIGDDSIEFVSWTDRSPSRYTVINENTLIFDAYDSDVDTTLQKTKSLGYGVLKPRAFALEDDWVPDLTDEKAALLFQEAKALAWAEMKQAANQKAEKSARKLWVRSQRHFPTIETPNYGRK